MTSRRQLWSPLVLGLALSVSACSGDDTPDAGPADAGAADTGVEVDAGPEDTGVQGPCNPIDGTGCNETDKFCVLQIDDDEGQCRELINPATFEGECSQSLQNCPAGMACLFLQGDDNPTCRKVCDVRSGEGCEGLTGSAAAYECSLRLQGIRQYGFCAPAAESCDPLDNMCPAQENCDFVNSDGDTGCVAAGPTQVGGNCMRDRCRRGFLCAAITNINGGDQVCYQPCDLQNPTCTQPNHACGDIGAPFGLCVPE